MYGTTNEGNPLTARFDLCSERNRAVPGEPHKYWPKFHRRTMYQQKYHQVLPAGLVLRRGPYQRAGIKKSGVPGYGAVTN